MLIRNCSLEGKTGRFNVRISDDKIIEITQFSASLEPQKSEEVFEADGALLTSALAEPHAHLDKAFFVRANRQPHRRPNGCDQRNGGESPPDHSCRHN